MKYPNLINAVFGQPWAITEGYMDIICGVIESRIADTEAAGVPGKLQFTKRPAAEVENRNGVAIIPMMGVISPRMNLFSEISGGTSIEKLQDEFMAAHNSPDTVATLFRIDSPGGNVQGVFEFADVIWQMRSQSTKPVLAHIEGTGCSAAYLIASQCDNVTATVGSEAGSIGVIVKMQDSSRAEMNDGRQTHIIRSDPTKAPGSGPVTTDQLGYMQDRVNSLGAMFRAYVSRSRPGADLERAKAMSLPASVVGSSSNLPSAAEVGLIDSISTLDEVVRQYGRRATK